MWSCRYGCYGYSMKDLVVSNPVPGAAVPKIVHKIEEEKDMINLQVRNVLVHICNGRLISIRSK